MKTTEASPLEIRTTVAPAESYQPQLVYKGDYPLMEIFYKNPGSTKWNQMSKSDNYLTVVKCQSALKSLGANGQWRGHFKKDGSCGSPDEPTLFAIGNRINFEMLKALEAQ